MIKRIDDLRLDRLAIRLVVLVGSIWAYVSAVDDHRNTYPTWRFAVAGIAITAVLVGLMIGNRWWAADSPEYDTEGWSTLALWVMSVGALVVISCMPRGGLAFIAYVPIVTAMRMPDLSHMLALCVPPVAGFFVASLYGNNGLTTLLVDLLAVGGIVIISQQRRRQLEAVDLAASQEVVIARERSRVDAAERQREVAAQLHDVLAHTLSGLIVSLQTAGLQARQENASEALQQRLSAATELAREGLVGARDAVESLKGEATAATATPLQQWLTETVQRLRDSTGAQIDITGDATAMTADRQQVAEAVLRESLTNAIRHSPGWPISITLSATEIQLITYGDVAAAPQTDHVSGGNGLAGLRERVTAGGGSFTAGPSAEGWQVRACWEAS